ncbi:MAG: isoprenylcysteine carboxylmethyltransferase family protein [Proteobacteria bacterium]|nr:isoprenylcysteine carboxylmethyltransferase family protein [Pseudomonadota bacterium]
MRFYRMTILALWLAWALYWAVAAFGTKVTQRREPWGSRLAYALPLLVAGAMLFGRWPWLSQRLWAPAWWTCWSGVALTAAGLGFACWARVHLGRNWSGAVTVKREHELIRSGPYGLVRHPIYTGLIAAVAGTALCSGTTRAAVACLIIIAAFLYKARAEERFMRDTFPGSYPDYSDRVPMLVPFTASRRSAPR